MSRTYAQIRESVLQRHNLSQSEDAKDFLDAVMPETMRFIARNVKNIPQLIEMSTATWGANDYLSLATDFGIISYRSVRRMYVRGVGATGVGKGLHYKFLELEQYYNMFSVGYNDRIDVERDNYYGHNNRYWTIDYTTESNGRMMAYPINEGDVVTLFTDKNLDTFDESDPVPLPGDFDYILYDACQVLLALWKVDKNTTSDERVLNQSISYGMQALEQYIASHNPEIKLVPGRSVTPYGRNGRRRKY